MKTKLYKSLCLQANNDVELVGKCNNGKIDYVILVKKQFDQYAGTDQKIATKICCEKRQEYILSIVEDIRKQTGHPRKTYFIVK